MKKNFLMIFVVFVAFLIAGCEKETAGPNVPPDPPPPPPEKILVIIANFTLPDPPPPPGYGYGVELQKDGITYWAIDNHGDNCYQATGEHLNILYGQQMLGVARFAYGVNGYTCYGTIEPDDSVTFIAKDTVVLNFKCNL